MRKITDIIVHCSATKVTTDFTVEKLYHEHVTVNGWSDIGYHYYIRRDGQLYDCRPLHRSGAHTKGHNKHSVGICIEGGLDANGNAEDNYTDVQLDTLRLLVINLIGRFGVKNEPKGHREYSPDINGDGTITANEFIKECPCFDTREWWRSVTS